MKRILIRTLLLVGLPLGSGLGVFADDIDFLDRAKRVPAKASGQISEESPSRIIYKAVAGTREVAAGDVLDVYYEVRPALRPDYRSASNKEKAADKGASREERKKALNDAIKEYRDLLPKIADVKFAARHVQFKTARLLARIAEEDSSEAGPAIDTLLKFKAEHPDSWQITLCCKLLAQLQLDKGDFEGARKTYEDLTKVPGVTREVRQESELLIAQALTRAKKYPEAEKRLQDALKLLPPDDPQAVRVLVYLAECRANSGKLDDAVQQLKVLIDKTNDNALKALAYNTLGDCYRATDKLEDALFSYLWVDVIYNQDKQEHAKAMTQLAKLFETYKKDEARAKQYREKLLKTK